MNKASSTGGVIIPKNWQFTPEWLTPIIARQHPGARLSEVTLMSGSDGTSSRALFGLKYAEGSGPAAVFAKTQGDWLHRLLHLMTGNLYNEALIFSSDIKLPVEHPRAYHGAVDSLRLNELVIMEDLKPRGVTLNDATKPLSFEEVANGLRGLAKLHSKFWRFTESTHPGLKWVKRWDSLTTFQFILWISVGKGINNLKDSLPPELAALGAKGMEKWWSRYMKTVNRGPLTLLHGDAHVGNTYSVPGGDFGFLDWACVRKGNWAFDVGYFLISALDVADRRKYEAELIEIYRKALDLPAEDLPTKEEAWLRYRTTPPYGLAVWLATGSSINYQSRTICSNLVNRFATAFLDLETPSALERLEGTL